jgi:hypothetical protein
MNRFRLNLVLGDKSKVTVVIKFWFTSVQYNIYLIHMIHTPPRQSRNRLIATRLGTGRIGRRDQDAQILFEILFGVTNPARYGSSCNDIFPVVINMNMNVLSRKPRSRYFPIEDEIPKSKFCSVTQSKAQQGSRHLQPARRTEDIDRHLK